MRIEVIPTAATLGAEVDRVTLRNLDDASFAEIEQAFNQHTVLIFRDQHLTSDEQFAFARRFGELEMYNPKASNSAGTEAEGTPLIVDISNVDDNGVHITDNRHPLIRQRKGNEAWHSDSSFRPRGAKASVLAAIEVATVGGETEFADMRAAYDALSTQDRQRLDPLHAWHSISYSRAVVGASDDEPASDPTTMWGARQPVVRRHPVTRRPSLFIGRHACHVFGMEVGEGQSLLHDLVVDACQPPRVLSHRWRVGDVVIWDNRCVLHRARPWDLAERRVLRHARVAGDLEPDDGSSVQ